MANKIVDTMVIVSCVALLVLGMISSVSDNLGYVLYGIMGFGIVMAVSTMKWIIEKVK